VRNVAWQMNRAERARREHEERALSPEPAAPADDLVAEAELQRRVVDAVLALDEPYRSTLLQRFFRGLSAEEIGKREGIPAATVRSRLKRGLDQLRSKFSDEQHVNRGAWIALVLPAASLKPAAATSAVALSVGGVVMSVKAVISGLAVIALIATAFVLGMQDGEPPEPAAGDSSVAADVAPAAPEASLREAIEEQPSAATTEGTARQVDPIRRETVPAGGTVLAGQVVDAATSAPVENFFVQVWDLGDGGSKPLGSVVRQSVNSPEGRFRLPLDRQGLYRLSVSSSRHASKRLDDLRLDDASGLTDLVIQLDSGRAVSGRVVDDRTGAPVEGAVVGTAQGEQGAMSDLTWLLRGEPELCLHAKTDAEGRFTLSGLEDVSQKIAAVQADYAEGWQQLIPSEVESVEIRLRRGPVIHGTVFGDDGTPKAGAWIRMLGGEIPLNRMVVSGQDGTYRTPPVRPGTVELYACPPADSDQDEFGFSSEWLAAKVEDADVQLDFGVSREYATWRGTLSGERGEREPGARIMASFRPPDWTGFEHLEGHSRSEVCDREGRFEFRKLPPGQYSLYVRLEDGSSAGWPPAVYLKRPGVIEQDIRLGSATAPGKGGEIHGRVVESGTEAPVVPKRGDDVSGFLYQPVFRPFRAELDELGRFSLKDLPPGTYSVSASVGDRRSDSLQLQVREGEIIQDVRLSLLAMGTLRLRLLGFRGVRSRAIQYSIESQDGNGSENGDGTLAENGSFERRYPLTVGAWRLLLTVEGLGQAEASFQIRSGLVTKVDLRPADLILFSDEQRTYSVEGTLVWENGAPIARGGISIYASQVPGVSESEKSRYQSTDEEGTFSDGGLLPGRYWVRAILPSGTNVRFDDLVIALSDSDPIRLRLVVPGGTLSGSLYDARTGAPFTEAGPMWWIFVLDNDSRKPVAEIQGGHTGPRFEVKGIPSGTLQLMVSARGYDKYVSEPFDYGGRFEKDLGSIRLEPCGVFEFNVVDSAGRAIPDCQIYLNDQVLPAFQRVPLEGGGFSHVDLPLGEVTLSAAADGYVTTSITVTLEAGKPGEHRFVLEQRED